MKKILLKILPLDICPLQVRGTPREVEGDEAIPKDEIASICFTNFAMTHGGAFVRHSSGEAAAS